MEESMGLLAGHFAGFITEQGERSGIAEGERAFAVHPVHGDWDGVDQELDQFATLLDLRRSRGDTLFEFELRGEQGLFVALKFGNVFGKAGGLLIAAVGAEAGKGALPQPADLAIFRANAVIRFRGSGTSLIGEHALHNRAVVGIEEILPGGRILKQTGGGAAGDALVSAADIVIAIGLRILDPENLVDIFAKEKELLLGALEFGEHPVDALREAG